MDSRKYRNSWGILPAVRDKNPLEKIEETIDKLDEARLLETGEIVTPQRTPNYQQTSITYILPTGVQAKIEGLAIITPFEGILSGFECDNKPSKESANRNKGGFVSWDKTTREFSEPEVRSL